MSDDARFKRFVIIWWWGIGSVVTNSQDACGNIVELQDKVGAFT